MKIIKFILIVALSLYSENTFAQAQKTNYTTSSQPINFGRFIRLKKLSSATVTITPEGTITHSPDLLPVPNSGVKAGIIDIDPLKSYKIDFNPQLFTTAEFDINPTVNPTSLIGEKGIGQQTRTRVGATIKLKRAENIGTISDPPFIIASSDIGWSDLVKTKVYFTITIDEPDISFDIPTALDFGTLRSTPTGYTVTVDKNGNTTSSVAGVIFKKNPFAASQTRILGTVGTNVTLNIPSTITLKGSDGGTMEVTIDSSQYSIEGATGLNTVIKDGGNAITIGGTLTVNDYQPIGEYSGSFVITADY